MSIRHLVGLGAAVIAAAAVAASGAAGPSKTPAGPPVPVPVGAVASLDCVVTPARWMRCRVPSSGRPATVLLRAWADGSAAARVVAPPRAARR